MACREKNNGALSAVELIAERGLEGLPEALTMLIDTAMRLERERHLGVESYERSGQRRGYANGYKPKTVKTRVGELTLAVPQVREGGFYPQSLEKGLRSERALKLALAEMYVSGVSTRKVARITEQLCGFEVSSTQVSRCAAMLERSSLPGAAERWARMRTWCSMPGTNRCVTLARWSMLLCCSQWACERTASGRSSGSPRSYPKRKSIGASSCSISRTVGCTA